MDNYAVKLFESLQKLKVTDENKAEVEKIKQDIRKKDFKKALDRIEKIKNSNVEKKNKELYKNAADVPDDDFFTNDEVKEEANTESQKEDNKEDGYNNDENYDDNYGNDYDDYDEFSEDPLFKKLKAYKDEEGWAKSAILNVANSGKFSSDRTIQEYVDDIWHLDKVTVDMSVVED